MLKGQSQQIIHLLVIEGDRCKRTIALEAATYSIACGLSNSVVLHSQSVCGLHAIKWRVTMADASYLFHIVDENLQTSSINGLFVNDKRCFHKLKHEDEIAFGGNIKTGYYANENLSKGQF